MSKKKQIEEMKKRSAIKEMELAIRNKTESCQTCTWYKNGVCDDSCELAEDNKKICADLYNAGYRKQSENTVYLPCKVGQWVYVPWRWNGQQAVAMVEIEEINFYDSAMHYMFFIDMESDDESFNQSFGGWKTGQSIGETVFLTKEEAEKALAKMKGGAE